MVHTHLMDMVILSGVLRVVISDPDGAPVSVPRGQSASGVVACGNQGYYYGAQSRIIQCAGKTK